MRSLRRFAPALVVVAASAFLLGNEADPTQAPNGAVLAERFAIAADHPAASDVGFEILQAGGTAADAAAAVMLTLGVVNPASSGLGGGGFALYYRASDRTLTFLDFRERSPGASSTGMFPTPDSSRVGGLATGVPGEPAGLDELLRRFGRLGRQKVTAPAIHHARGGFAVHRVLSERSREPGVRNDALLRTWFADGQTALEAGERIENPALARTLTVFARQGARPFYRGAVARAIVAANRRTGGIMTARDLSEYRVVERAPLERQLFGHRWITAPPPSAGGYVMLASLALLEQWSAQEPFGAGDGALQHAMIESWKGPTFDRAQYFGDPDALAVPVEQLLAPEWITKRGAHFRREAAVMRGLYEERVISVSHPTANDGGTSHVCVVDADGNIASVTSSVNLAFGAQYTAAGMVMNNQMDDFATTGPNAIDASKRPVSNMAPTLVFRDDRPVLCIGGSGGARIPTALAQVAYHTLVRGVSPAQALLRPRVHFPRDNDPRRAEVVHFEPALPAPVQDALRSQGHTLVADPTLGAAVQVIRLRNESPHLIAAADGRKGGYARGE